MDLTSRVARFITACRPQPRELPLSPEALTFLLGEPCDSYDGTMKWVRVPHACPAGTGCGAWHVIGLNSPFTRDHGAELAAQYPYGIASGIPGPGPLHTPHGTVAGFVEKVPVGVWNACLTWRVSDSTDAVDIADVDNDLSHQGNLADLLAHGGLSLVRVAADLTGSGMPLREALAGVRTAAEMPAVTS